MGRPGLAAVVGATLIVALGIGLRWLLHRPLLPLRLRVRWRGARLTATLVVGWPRFAYRSWIHGRLPGPLRLRQSLHLPVVCPQRPTARDRRRGSKGPLRLRLPPPSPGGAAPTRPLLRLLAADGWEIRRLSLRIAAGVVDAAATAWLAGSLWALTGAAAAAVAGRRAAGPVDVRVEPAFGRHAWALDLDCIARLPPWEAMSAAWALRSRRRSAATGAALDRGRGRCAAQP
ncbi:MAG TPA: hypothetical protein VIL40_03425 [Thermaerobacter sp.]